MKSSVQNEYHNYWQHLRVAATWCPIPRNAARVIRRVYIPKGDGSERPLGLPTVEDKILQMAVVTRILTPIFEQEFDDSSYRVPRAAVRFSSGEAAASGTG